MSVMRYANVLLFTASLLLEANVLITLFRGRLHRRLTTFMALLLFYVVRGIALLTIAKLVAHPSYVRLVSVLALVDVTLEVAVAILLYLQIRSRSHVSANRELDLKGIFLALVGLATAGALTVLLASIAPLQASLPLDRGILFCAFLFMTYFVATWRELGDGLERLILQGFASLGLSQVLSQWGKAIATTQRSPHLFLFCAYGDAMIWLLILLMWSIKLRSTTARVDVRAGSVLQPMT